MLFFGQSLFFFFCRIIIIFFGGFSFLTVCIPMPEDNNGQRPWTAKCVPFQKFRVDAQKNPHHPMSQHSNKSLKVCFLENNVSGMCLARNLSLSNVTKTKGHINPSPGMYCTVRFISFCLVIRFEFPIGFIFAWHVRRWVS